MFLGDKQKKYKKEYHKMKYLFPFAKKSQPLITQDVRKLWPYKLL